MSGIIAQATIKMLERHLFDPPRRVLKIPPPLLAIADEVIEPGWPIRVRRLADRVAGTTCGRFY
jgi:hypothetical protein